MITKQRFYYDYVNPMALKKKDVNIGNNFPKTHYSKNE